MREFRLVSRWHVDAPVDAVWDMLADPAFTWPSWWPQLSAEEVVAAGGRTADRWSRVRVRVRSPLGWSLRFGLVLESAHEPGPGPGSALLLASGNLVGKAAVVVAPLPAPLARDDDGGATEVTLTWSVALVRAGVVGRLIGLLPRWALTAAHAAVMRAGERGLRSWLKRNPLSPTSDATSPRPPTCAAPP